MNTSALKEALKTLEVKRRSIEDQMKQVNDLIAGLRSLMNGSGPAADFVAAAAAVPRLKRRYTKAPVGKAFVKHDEPGALRYKYEKLDPVWTSIEYIRERGTELSAKELFDHFCALGGYPKVNRKQYYPRFYQAIHSVAIGYKGKDQYLTQRVDRAGIGKKAMFNVNSALLLQHERQLQNPAVAVTESQSAKSQG